MNTRTNTQELATQAEAFLFTEGGTMTRKKLASLLECKEGELSPALDGLARNLEGRGLSLIQTDSEVALVVSKENSEAVRQALERELSRDIGDAGLEVLAIVLYRGPSTRAQIDYIRGVNTASTLRNLLARGLLERVGNPEDAREYLYRPTVDLLSHLGIPSVKELPDYATIRAELAAFEEESAKEPFAADDNAN